MKNYDIHLTIDICDIERTKTSLYWLIHLLDWSVKPMKIHASSKYGVIKRE